MAEAVFFFFDILCGCMRRHQIRCVFSISSLISKNKVPASISLQAGAKNHRTQKEMGSRNAIAAFKRIDKVIAPERQKIKGDLWTNMTMLVDEDGFMHTDFDYTAATPDNITLVIHISVDILTNYHQSDIMECKEWRNPHGETDHCVPRL